MSSQTLKQIQNRFVEQLKTPEKAVEETWLKDIEGRRLAIYQRLLRNNLFRFIDNAFPVLKKLSREQAWSEVKERFFRNFSSQSPYFTGIAESFVEYLREHDELFVFAAELAHYEWAEIAAEQKAWPQNYTCFQQPLNENHIVGLNPTAIVASYEYPVDEIGSDFQPEKPLTAPRFLVVFRDTASSVRFIRINAMTYLLLTELQNSNGVVLRNFLQRLPELLPQWPAEQLQQGALQTLQRFSEQQLLIMVKN
ncbi:DUF2063 domain-containing protein [Idiomarina sp. HP20-50]|uniref:HvfC family RiPP maturation protein n=1 Tax=Idiomarina sp. HP20-50 TaxID=3070813 RepID=UPI00294AE49C|nr:putative DNA-binding domain-containing protein [Idiomarina sp. HP20-50]MDV6317157.1 putative DNA-binding domain-containing protein [Idiomarina sp. HP20-50]